LVVVVVVVLVVVVVEVKAGDVDVGGMEVKVGDVDVVSAEVKAEVKAKEGTTSVTLRQHRSGQVRSGQTPGGRKRMKGTKMQCATPRHAAPRQRHADLSRQLDAVDASENPVCFATTFAPRSSPAIDKQMGGKADGR
jgi:hypothetical protein